MTIAKKAVAKKTVVKKAVVKKAVIGKSSRIIKTMEVDGVQDIYIDGMSSLMVGPSMAKISFHTTINASEDEELRKISLRLVMSSEVLIAMVEKLQSSIQKNKKNLINGLEAHQQKMLDLINNS